MTQGGVFGSEDVLGLAARWHAEGEAVAVATVVRTWGSSPRPVGSQMVVTGSGRVAGSVSGGCVEGAVAEAAAATLASGMPRVLEYGVTDAQAWAVGLACGGSLGIFLERLG